MEIKTITIIKSQLADLVSLCPYLIKENISFSYDPIWQTIRTERGQIEIHAILSVYGFDVEAYEFLHEYIHI